MFLWMTLQIYKMEFESQTGEIKSIWSIYLFIYLFGLKFSFLCNSEISICLTVPCVLTFPFQIHLFLLGAETECFLLFLAMALGRRE